MPRHSVLTNSITDPYSDLEAWMYDTFFAPAILEMVRAEIEALCGALDPDSEILDVGCGGGHIPLAMLGMRPDLRTVGVDLSPKQVERARRRAEKAGVEERVRFEAANALDLPFEESRFDAVISVTSIKHWSPREAGLAECLRVLKTDGRLLLVEVDRGCHLDALKRFVRSSRVPRPLKPVAMPLLRTFIFGQGLDLDELRELLGIMPLAEGRVGRIPELPAVVLSGIRLSDEASLREVG